ncbi:glucans biosynthesis glucosyltransferase MdoH [Sphingomonas naphthae]|uniref:Glucans biosynthesis glucosyltransferase H n=1 Tax=Sphingomonas naphthae TaxID=1813468 RepID=A0ABY7TL95_9SPHN|nr:glucans biosynthesis glucosyltransferase MdoH [Sphingomonas naphthae]WCT74002.1 glucans biosynthesis glucosyltransferase MdoH [Sphingomonas naphthae]
MSAAPARATTPASAPVAMPPETPIAMPVQDLNELPRAKPLPVSSPVTIDLRRAILIGATACATIFASVWTTGAAAEDGLQLSEVLLILLVLPLFAWITFSFVQAVAGFICLATGTGHEMIPLPTGRRPKSRAAILMPIHNEGANEVMSRVAAMIRSLEKTAGGDMFDIFILSDTTDQEIRRAEAIAWAALAGDSKVPLYYRLREKNVGRKPGNIADWVRRHGGGYEQMIVLDADSLMGGPTMVRMVTAMEANSGTALIQTMPVVAGARTLFARWQQFSARLYSPVSSAGLMWWSGSEATFWGHNAIIRTRAFAEGCGLPDLSGPAPFGGAILSHDLVEAALLRRQGWAVHMVELPESFEEFPPTPIDHAIRDRRWCQGNIQHLRLLTTPGLHWVSRLQLLMGASSYMIAPLWMLLIVAGALVPNQGGIAWFETPGMSRVLFFTVLLLLGPKLMGLVWTLIDNERRRSFGGTDRILASAVVEMPLAIVMAPVTMVTHLIMLWQIARGRAAKWSAQRRDAHRLEAGEAFSFYRVHMVVGALVLATMMWSGHSLWWTAPVALGLIGAPIFAMIASRRDWGLVLAREGLFVTPEERTALRIDREEPGSRILTDALDRLVAWHRSRAWSRHLRAENPSRQVTPEMLTR